MCVYISTKLHCLHDLFVTNTLSIPLVHLLGTSHGKTHRWNPSLLHLFPYSIAPCARAAACMVISMLLCGAPQVFSQRSTCVFQVIELSVAIDPYEMTPSNQSFLVMTNFYTTLQEFFLSQGDGVDTSDL